MVTSGWPNVLHQRMQPSQNLQLPRMVPLHNCSSKCGIEYVVHLVLLSPGQTMAKHINNDCGLVDTITNPLSS
jgi:hypothetical protein